MSILLDVLVFVALVFAVFQGLRRNLMRCLVSYVTLFLVAALSLMIAVPLGSLTATAWVSPGQQRKAANQMAQMLGEKGGKNGLETVASLNVRKLIEEQPEDFVKLCQRYQADVTSLSALLKDLSPEEEAAFYQQFLRDMVEPYSKTYGYLYSFLFLFLLLSVAVRVLYMRYGSFKYPKSAYPPLRVTLSIFSCVLYVSLAAFLLRMTAPYLSGAHPGLFPSGFLEETVLFKIFSQYNIWGWLLK